LCHDLKHSGADTVLARLRSTVADAGAPGQTVTQLAYLEKRADQMAYARFQAQQWPIARGSVESATKLVVEQRLKGPGMHWAEANVNPMLALRNAISSDRSVEVSTQIEQEQRREQRTRRLERQRRRRAALSESEHSAADAGGREQGGVQDDGVSAAPVRPPQRAAAEKGRQAADHRWRKAWSIRRQREIASTA